MRPKDQQTAPLLIDLWKSVTRTQPFDTIGGRSGFEPPPVASPLLYPC